MEKELVFRIIIVGDTGVGKSCILLRFSENTFKEQHNVTIGVEFGSKIMRIDKNILKLQIWDTAGQESFRSITRSFYRRADGVLLVYDVTARQSFENCEYWLEEIRQNGSLDIVVYLVGNQVDLVEDSEDSRQVTFDEGRQLADKYHLSGFMETSAKSGFHVEESFTVFVKEMLSRWDERKNTQPMKINTVLMPKQKKKKRCC